MGPGVDPHLYRATEGDVHRLATADLIVYNGLHLEGKMSDILAKMNTYAPTMAASDALNHKDLIQSDEFDGMYDPHIWFDPKLWQKVCSYMRDTLCMIDPQHKEVYQHNTQLYLKKINDVQNAIEKLVAMLDSNRRTLITAHDAFGYFGRAYHFNVVGLQGISTEAESGIKDVQDLANFIVRNKIPAIFVESSVPERTLQAVQKAVHAQGWTTTIGPELYSDALGNPDSPAGTYLGMLYTNAHNIITHLLRT